LKRPPGGVVPGGKKNLRVKGEKGFSQQRSSRAGELAVSRSKKEKEVAKFKVQRLNGDWVLGGTPCPEIRGPLIKKTAVAQAGGKAARVGEFTPPRGGFLNNKEVTVCRGRVVSTTHHSSSRDENAAHKKKGARGHHFGGLGGWCFGNSLCEAKKKGQGGKTIT